MEKRQRFTAQFKREAVQLIGRSSLRWSKWCVSSVSLALCSASGLMSWNRRDEWACRGSGRPKASSDDLVALQREEASAETSSGKPNMSAPPTVAGEVARRQEAGPSVLLLATALWKAESHTRLGKWAGRTFYQPCDRRSILPPPRESEAHGALPAGALW